ncbi:hypothetical protein E2I00_012578, partial [Balaenoptera physalus]
TAPSLPCDPLIARLPLCAHELCAAASRKSGNLVATACPLSAGSNRPSGRRAAAWVLAEGDQLGIVAIRPSASAKPGLNYKIAFRELWIKLDILQVLPRLALGLQTGIPGLDWSEAIEIHKGETRRSHHNPQLWMGQQPQGWLPVPTLEDEEEGIVFLELRGGGKSRERPTDLWPHFIFQVPEVRKKFAPNPSAIFQASAPRILNM